MPEMIVLTTEEAEALLKQTLADVTPQNPFAIEPVLIEAGPNTGMWAVPSRCADHAAFQKHAGTLKSAPKENLTAATAFPVKTPAEKAAWVDPWASAKEEVKEGKEKP